MLDGPLLLPPLLLAGLLLLSGIAKVRQSEATRSAFAELKLPSYLVRSPAPRVLPWAEIAMALALIIAPPPFALPVAVLTLILFVSYLVLILRALRFDYPVTCSCFGELGLGEVTRRTAVRNVLLTLLAVVGLWSATASRSVAGRLVEAPAETWVWLGLVVLVGAALMVTFAAKGVSPAEELDYIAQPLPFAALVAADGTTRTLAELARESAVLLIFVSPHCGSCKEPIAKIPQWAQQMGPVLVRAVTSRPIPEVLAAAPELDGLLLQDPHSTTTRIFGLGTPGAVLLGADGTLSGGPVRGKHAVLAFAEDIHQQLLDEGVITA